MKVFSYRQTEIDFLLVNCLLLANDRFISNLDKPQKMLGGYIIHINVSYQI